MARTYLGYTQTAANADLDAIVNGERGTINVALDEDAAGTTNRATLVAAIAAAMALGGARLTAKPGVYSISGTTTTDIPFPISAADYQPATLPTSAHFYALNPTGLHFDMPGVTLQSTEDETEGTNDAVFLFDGARDCVFNIGKIVTTTDLNLTTGAVNVTGRNAILLTATARDSYNIQVPSLIAENCYTAVYVVGVTLSATRVRGLHIGTLYAEECLYGLRLFDNGDDVTFDSIVTKYVGRPVFLFGVSEVRGNAHNTQNLSGLQLLIKAYDRDTQNISIRYRVYSDNTGSARVALSSEHNVAAQPTPGVLRNIAIDYDDTGSNHPALGINFSYLVDGVSTPTCATTLFNGIRLSGVMDDSTITSGVLQSPTGNLETDGLIAIGGSSYIPLTAIYASGGFYRLLQVPNAQGIVFRNFADSGSAGSMGATTSNNLQILGLVSGGHVQFLATLGKIQLGTVAAGVRSAVSINGLELLSLTAAQRDALTSVTEGTLIFNTDSNKLNFYTGAGWEAVTSA
jgi:hypothetical protein